MNRKSLWELYALSKHYGVQPSVRVGLDPLSWVGYDLDRVTLAWGLYVEGKLNERDKQGRPKYSLAFLLSDPNDKKSKAFAPVTEIAGVKVRKMAIPESGVW